MNKIVLDASALLALLNEEPGHEIVEKHLPHAIMSAVNIAETVTVLADIGVKFNEAENLIEELIPEIVPFDENQAYIVASLRKNTKQLGLSLGDRACLALAKQKNLTALSADKAWAKLKLDIEIQILR